VRIRGEPERVVSEFERCWTEMGQASELSMRNPHFEQALNWSVLCLLKFNDKLPVAGQYEKRYYSYEISLKKG
jgi:hypothetical protein